MSVWSRLYCPFITNILNRPMLISIIISTTLLLAFVIYRVFFHIPAPVPQGRYKPSKLNDVEDIEGYEHGGFHPVHLGDIYNDQYKILHKLEWGGFSTVWLARDLVLSRYVALKIILADRRIAPSSRYFKSWGAVLGDERKAEGGRYVGGLLDNFVISGPNGTHLCLVSELKGPSIGALGDSWGKVGDWKRLQANFTRKIARQVVLGLKFLHSKQIYHGSDLTSSNILYKLSPIDHWSEDEIYQHFGQPKIEPVVTLRHSWVYSLFKSRAPRYQVECCSVEDHQHIIDEIQLVDFGLSFSFDSPPGVEDLGIPCAYRAPETIFDTKADQQSEIWALGCVLYELRNGQKLFDSRSGRKDEILVQILKILGRVPKIWEKAWMEKLDQFARDKQATAEHLDGIGAAPVGADDGLVRLNERRRKAEAFIDRSDMGEDPEETVQFGNLLNGIFRWIPEERLSLDDILDHPWFTTI